MSIILATARLYAGGYIAGPELWLVEKNAIRFLSDNNIVPEADRCWVR